jgi:hypothetical protein
MSSKMPISLSNIIPSAPSICIPRVYKNITLQRIKDVFQQLNLGDIERVDIIRRTSEKGEEYQRVFIHFKTWFRNSDADRVRNKLLTGSEVKIVYDDPWFWKISANRSERKESGPKQPSHHQHQHQSRRPTIEFDDQTPQVEARGQRDLRKPRPQEDLRRDLRKNYQPRPQQYQHQQQQRRPSEPRNRQQQQLRLQEPTTPTSPPPRNMVRFQEPTTPTSPPPSIILQEPRTPTGPPPPKLSLELPESESSPVQIQEAIIIDSIMVHTTTPSSDADEEEFTITPKP